MTRTVSTYGLTVALLSLFLTTSHVTYAAGPGQQSVTAAAKNNQFAFIMFYRSNDKSAQEMHETIKSTLGERKDAVIVPVQISDSAELGLIQKFDATRIPMPAVAILAPNGAICSVIPGKVSAHQLNASFVSPGQAECLKALQENKIVLLCAQPTKKTDIPEGVRQFQSDKQFTERTKVVSVLANDPNEAKFLQQLRMRTDQQSSVIAFMAPPGVMMGIYNGDVSFNMLTEKLADAGKCCDDKNCKHHQHKAATAPHSSRR